MEPCYIYHIHTPIHSFLDSTSALSVVFKHASPHHRYFFRFKKVHVRTTGTAVAQWLRCCVTNRKVAGSIPDGVIGIFH